MIIVHVHIHVLSEYIEAFKEATIENARNSVLEPGITRFDAIQQQDDPTRFILIEIYRTVEATIAHKQTAHYAKWRDAVQNMMAEPRSSVKFNTVYPDETAW
jgi:autoinducer 2-degrading protein